MSLRGIVFGLLTAVAIVVSGAALPASAAQGSSGYIYVQSALNGVSPNSSAGLVSVSIAATSPLTSMTVSVYVDSQVTYGCTGGTDVLDLAMSDFVQPGNDGNGQYGTWTLATPITTSRLSIGSYQVCLTAADQGGDSVSTYVGPLYFLDYVEFPTFQASGTSFNYDNQDVTLTGNAVLLAPDGTTTPFAGQTLTVVTPDSNGLTTVTGSDGSFFVTLQVTESGPYSVYYQGSYSGSSPEIDLTLTTFPVQITYSLTATQVKEGDPVSVSGTVTYDHSGVIKPLANTTVGLYYAPYYYGDILAATAVTDASGNFTMSVPTTQSGTYVLAIPSTMYFQLGQTSQFNVYVAQQNEFKVFNATLSKFAVLSVSGCVTPQYGDVLVEYAASPSGPWTTLGTAPVDSSQQCGGGYEFSGSLTAKLAAAYYRAEYLATPDWQGAVSKSVYLWKYVTRITSFSVSPRRVARNGHITVSGRLWVASNAGKWHAYGHRRVMVVFRYRRKWYRYPNEPVTSSAGWFRASFKVYASSLFFAQYNGDSTHFACASRRIRVTAAASLSSPALGVAPQFLVRAIWQAAPRMVA